MCWRICLLCVAYGCWLLGGWCSAGEDQSPLVSGIDFPELVGAVWGEGMLASRVGAWPRGVEYEVRKGDKAIAWAAVGVFADPKAASAILDEYKKHTSLGPSIDLSGKIGDKTLRWGQRSIAFSRDNVVVALTWADGPLEEAVVAMDGILSKGGKGVVRGSKVGVPVISAVEMPEKITAGSEVTLKVHVMVPEGANGDGLGVADAMGGALPSRKPAALQEVVYSLPYYAPKVDKEKRDSFWISYATAGNVLVSKEVCPTVVPK